MSSEKLSFEAGRWYLQSIDDLEAAQALLMAKKYAQSCFYSQQASEKAMKAVWTKFDLNPWGHSVTRLIRELPTSLQTQFLSCTDFALALDKLYIPTRYPDALAELTPAEAYTLNEAEQAIKAATTILSHVKIALD